MPAILLDTTDDRTIPPRALRRSVLPALSFFVLFTLACGDVLSLPIGGGNFWLFYLAGLFAFVIWFRAIRFDPSFTARVFVFLALLIPSIVLSVDRNRSMLYLVWVVLTLICTLGAFPRLIWFDATKGPMLGGVRLYDVLLHTFRLQIVLGILIYAAGLHERPKFSYYEPSYFAISLAVYCSIVAHRIREQKPFALDLALMVAFLITSASGAFILVLLMTAALNLPRLRLKYVLAGVVGIAAAGTAYVELVDDTNTEIIRSFIAADVDLYAVLLRGGNRLGRLLAAWDVWNDHPAFGVGLGSFETVSRLLDLDEPGTTDYLSSNGKPAINVYLEILATTGVAGLIGFAVLLWPVLRWIAGKGFSSPISRSLICMLVILNWESNFLRPYVWVAIAICWAEMRNASPLRTSARWFRRRRRLVSGSLS